MRKSKKIAKIKDSVNIGRYSFCQIATALKKLYDAGYNTDKKILSLKLDDLYKNKNFTPEDIMIILLFYEALLYNEVIDFFIEM